MVQPTMNPFLFAYYTDIFPGRLFQTIRTHGFLGLYAGSMPLIVGSSAKQAARWTAYEKVSSLFPRDENGKLSVFANATAGVAAGVSEALLAVTPMESLKTVGRCSLTHTDTI